MWWTYGYVWVRDGVQGFLRLCQMWHSRSTTGLSCQPLSTTVFMRIHAFFTCLRSLGGLFQPWISFPNTAEEQSKHSEQPVWFRLELIEGLIPVLEQQHMQEGVTWVWQQCPKALVASLSLAYNRYTQFFRILSVSAHKHIAVKELDAVPTRHTNAHKCHPYENCWDVAN